MKSFSSLNCFRSLLSFLSTGFLFGLVFAGCISDKSHIESYNKLQRNSLVFNEAFKNKRSDPMEMLIPVDIRDKFMEEFHEIKKRVTFDEVEIVKIAYFKDGTLLQPSRLGPEEDFDEAEITLRYQVVVSPSNSLKTIMLKQKWVKENDDWVIIPNLDPFFN